MPKSVLRMLWAHCSCALRGREKVVVGGSNIPPQVLQIEGSTEEKKKRKKEKGKCKFIAISQAHEIKHQSEKRAVFPLECTPIVWLKSGPQCFLLSGETSSQEPHHVVNSYINLSDSF